MMILSSFLYIIDLVMAIYLSHVVSTFISDFIYPYHLILFV